MSTGAADTDLIVLDASVLMPYFRSPTTEVRAIFEKCRCGIAGVTRAEVLHGAKSPTDADRLNAALNSFIQVPTPEPVWWTLGTHLRLLREAGLPMPVTDVLVATIALELGASVWCRDRHFSLMREVLTDLRLFDPASPE